jgi:hypothetical protein
MKSLVLGPGFLIAVLIIGDNVYPLIWFRVSSADLSFPSSGTTVHSVLTCFPDKLFLLLLTNIQITFRL